MNPDQLRIYSTIGVAFAIYVCFAIYAQIKGLQKEQIIKINKYLTPALVIIMLSISFYPLIPVWITAPLALSLGLIAAWGGRGYTEIIYRRHERLKEQENASIDKKSVDNKDHEA